MRRGLLTALLAACLVGGCAGPVAQPPTAVPEGPAATAPPQNAGPAAPEEPAAGPVRTDPVPVRSAAELPEVPETAPPRRLVIDGLGVDMPVDPVGVAPDGQMEIPEDAARAGWYRFGATVGAPAGTTVIAAHSGSLITALGPLRHLIDARPGDELQVDRADGVTVTYRVQHVELVDKQVIDLSEHFRPAGEHRLVLITCDGEWQQDRQSYTHNAVLTAVPVGP